MKKIFCMIAVSQLLFSLNAAVKEGEGVRLLDRQTALLSARLLHDKWNESWLAKNDPDGEEILYNGMKQNQTSCAAVAKAREFSEQLYRRTLAENYRQGADAILKPFDAILTETERKQLREVPPGLLERKCAARFPENFRKARNRLCAEQRSALFKQVYPSETELENKTDAVLIRTLTARFLRGTSVPLLEENISLLKTQMILPVLKSARTQQKRQMELAATLPVPPEIWEEAPAEEALQKNLEAATAQWKEPKVYRLFPKTLSALKQRAARLPEDRVVSRLSRYAVVPDYARMLQQAPAEHTDAKQSFARLSADFCNATLENAVRMSEMPAKQASSVRADSAVRRAVGNYFEKQVRPELQKIRRQEAATQMRTCFPDLVKGSWKPSPEEVEIFCSEGQNRIPALKGIDSSRPELLDETRMELKKSLLAKLKSAGREWRRQQQLVDLEYETVVREMTALEKGKSVSFLERWLGLDSGHVSLKQIRRHYEERVKTVFNEEAKRAYPELFESVRKEIDVRSRAILQRISTVNESEKPAPAEKPVKIVRCVVRIDILDGRLNVKIGNKVLTGSLRDKDYRSTEEKVTEGVLAEIRRIYAENAASKTKFRLEVQVLVLNGKIYYEFVARLRENLRRKLADSSPQVSDSLE